MQKRFVTTFETYDGTGETLGSGGAGNVFKVRNEDGQHFAVKVLDKSRITKLKRSRFKNEIRFCSREISPHLITVLDHGVTSDGLPFYVMPLYGSNLRQLLKRGIQRDEVLPLFMQILNGVEAAHLLNVCHRDLKPENILFDPASKKLVVADFGIAEFRDEDLYTAVETSDHERLANFTYCAPEQKLRGAVVDHRADLFALGLILNEMFTGEVAAGTKHKLISQVATDFAYLDDVVDKMRSQDPRDRFQSIRELKENLICRGNEFISLQRLNQLKNTVLSEAESDDPLVIDPIRVLEKDYQEEKLVFILSRTPNQTWIHFFQNPTGSYSYIGDARPDSFEFILNRVYVTADEPIVVHVVNHFANYVEMANRAYASYVAANVRSELEVRKRKVAAELLAEEKRSRILRAISAK